MRHLLLGSLFFLAMLFSDANSLPAAIITVGGTAGGNGIPFGEEVGSGRYQQVYSSSLFSGPFDINAIAFYARSTSGSYSADVSISISHTTRVPSLPNPGGLSPDLASNVTGVATTVFSDPSYTATLIGDTWTLDFDFSTTFHYDPTIGNLLVDMVLSNESAGFNFFASQNSPDANRAWDLTGGSVNQGNSADTSFLSTQFHGDAGSTIPEPTTLVIWSLLATLGLSFGWRRRRRA